MEYDYDDDNVDNYEKVEIMVEKKEHDFVEDDDNGMLMIKWNSK